MSYLDIRREPDIVVALLAAHRVQLHRQSQERWENEGVEVVIKVLENEQRVSVTAPRVAVTHIALRWKVPVPAHLRFLGDHWERGYGDMEWRSMVPERVMPWYFLSNDQQATHGYGVKTGAHSLCYWQTDPQGVTLWLDVRNGGNGVELGQRTLEAATIVTRKGEAGESSFQAAQALCRLLCDQPVLPKHPIYGGNNWYYAYGRSSHQEILDDSKLMASLAPDSENRPYMVIDDGWQVCHFAACNGGPWWQGNYLFPDMQKLAHEMREIGVRPGIWFRPLLTLEKVPESWVLAPARDANVNVGIVLDPSLPSVVERIQEDVRCLKNWGYELIKHDFSTFDILGKWGMQMKERPTDSGWNFADRTRTTAEIVLDFYKGIAAAAGETVIIGCNTIGHLGAGLFALQRTGDDTSGQDWERTRKMGINTLAFRMPQHDTFFASDADCVGLTNHVPWHLNRQWLDLLARSGTPLFVSAAPDAVGKEQERALKEAFVQASRVQEPAEPLDWLDTTCPEHWLIGGERVKFEFTSFDI